MSNISDLIESIGFARDTIRTKMVSMGQAEMTDKLETLAQNLDIVIYGKKISSTVVGNTITFTDDMIAEDSTIIDGPYVQQFHVTYVSAVIEGNTLVIDLANDDANGSTAYVYLR